jgi:hypothetical protein
LNVAPREVKEMASEFIVAALLTVLQPGGQRVGHGCGVWALFRVRKVSSQRRYDSTRATEI